MPVLCPSGWDQSATGQLDRLLAFQEDPMRIPGRLTAGIVPLAAALLALAVAACGGSTGDSGIASAGSGTASPSASSGSTNQLTAAEQGRKFAQCMRDHGVNMPDPGANGSPGTAVKINVSRAVMEAAKKACQKYAGNAGGPSGKKLDPAELAKMRQFAQCMRAHGLPNFPDPQASGGITVERRSGGSGGASGGGMRPDDPKFKAAQRACQPILGKTSQTRVGQAGANAPGPVSGGTS
jgi:hypothetical protein